ncbi:hypothetical protein BaRGS_00000192 [Batillaria attramentaria]|uniref:Sodium-dependent multivitamin transporter n=1 Tax=Batillaria attramentaria TaxID=370345 RepID=A0ABD0MBW3_9CAEN
MAAVTAKQFHWADYVVTVAMLLISLGVGFFFAIFRGGQKTKVEYLLGNRQISMLPVCLSVFVTFQSAIGLIGIPADAYNTGTMVVFVGIGIAFSHVVGCFTVVPVMYPLHLISVYEYLEMRFKSTAVRLFVTCVSMLQTIMYMGVTLYAPALALQAAAGLPTWVSVAAVGGVGTLYTTMGGIKSVVWTDAIQTVIIFIGLGAILVKGIIDVGGLTSLFHIANEGGRIIFDDQSSVQRIGSMKSLKDAKRCFLLNVPLLFLYGPLLTLTGLLLYAYVVTTGCDPYRAGLISNKNQMMPYFVIQVLSDLPGMAGIYMSMLFSGALSTVSSGINALAANTVEDLLARPLRGLKDTTVTIITKVIVLLFGVLAIGLAYLMKSVHGPVSQIAMTVIGACGGPMVGVFLLGGGFPRGNKYGALGGGVVGLVVNMWLAIGSTLYGARIQSLPPGPIYNCHVNTANASLSLQMYLNTSDVTGGQLDGTFSGSTPRTDGGNLVFSTVDYVVGVGNVTEMTTQGPFSMYDLSYLWLGVIGSLTSFIVGIIISFITGSTDVKSVDPKLIFPLCRKIYRMPEPVYKPEEKSNSLAMKNYREAWETFKRGSLHVDVAEDSERLSLQSGRPEKHVFIHSDTGATPECITYARQGSFDSY